MMDGRGDSLPVSALPIDGTFPTGTTKYEKRNIAERGAASGSRTSASSAASARSSARTASSAPSTTTAARLDGAPASFKAAPINARGYPDSRYTLQIYVEDCTGCGVCVENCPGAQPRRRPDQGDQHEAAAQARSTRSARASPSSRRCRGPTARGSTSPTCAACSSSQPLFEFSGACAGCGETPYLKLLSQLFGDRLQIANATGCSSIYGGNLPTTPWAAGADGRGPAWSNSLFEDNAEFGLGYRLAIDQQTPKAPGRWRASSRRDSARIW